MKNLIVIFAVPILYFSHCVATDQGRTKSIVTSGFALKFVKNRSVPQDFQYMGDDCDCVDYSCGCCTNLDFIDTKVCANFSYLPTEIGIRVTITYNNMTIVNETVSATNPPPICVFRIEKIHMELCLRLYHLDFNNFSGCAEIEMRLFYIFHSDTIQLGCFKLKMPFDDELENEEMYIKREAKNIYPEVILI